MSILNNLVGGTFIGLDTVTVPVLGGRKNPLKGRVTKIVEGSNVMCFGNTSSNAYENKVKRNLIAEGKDPESFKLSPRKWGVRRQGAPIVDHKGKEYLEVIFLKAGKVQYMIDGQPVDMDATLANMIGLKLKPVEGEQGGVDNKVIIRTYAMESITAMRVNGETLTA